MENIFNSKNKQDSNEFFSANRIQPREYVDIVDSAFADNLSEKLLKLHLDNISNTKPMNKNISFLKPLLFGAGGAFLGVLVLGIVMFGNTLFPQNKIGGEIAYIEGQVEYKSGQNGWMDASSSIEIAEGTSVRIIGEGKAIINLDDGSVVRMDSDSQTTFSSLNPENIILANDSGSIYTRVAKLDRDFAVTIDEDVYKSIGTAYKTINLDNKKGVRVYESTVEVIVKDKDGNVRVEQGKKFFTVDESSKDNELEVLPMSEEEIEKDTFTKWNIEEDKKIDEFKDKLGIFNEAELPKLNLSTPLEIETKEAIVKVEGTTNASKIKTNYGEKEIVDGAFSFEVEVPVGMSDIIVKAISNEGGITELRVKVNRLEDQGEEPSPTNPPKSAISLSGSQTSTGIKVNWSVSGIDTSKGFKVAYSTTNSSPSYPNDSAKLVDGSARSIEIPVKDGKTYYIRVCTYTGSGCGIYSNVAKVVAPTSTTSGTVKSISLTSTGGGNFKWNVDGTSSQGFKLVWSKNTNPTYPTRSGDYYNYYSNPSTFTGNIDDKDGAGTYYVRVCEYLGGKCGVYSNQVSYTFEAAEEQKDVSSISLKSTGGTGVAWTVNGYSESGYKVVWSQNSSPTYPTRDGDQYIYLSNPDEKSTSLDAFAGSGTYYVRVCEYLGGSCGVYSNQITVNL